MNSLIEPVETFLDGTVSVVRFNGEFDDHAALITEIDEAELVLSNFFPALRSDFPDPLLRVHPTIRHDQSEAARDPVSIEYILHFDGSCIPVRPLATLVVAREAGDKAPPTRFVSTTRLLGLASSLGIFKNIDPEQVDSVFGYSAYYSRVQQLWLDLEPNDGRLQEVIRQDLERDGVSSRAELVEKLDKDAIRHRRTFPLVAPHSITGEPSIMVDSGARNIELQAKSGVEDIDVGELKQVFDLLQLLLADSKRLEAEEVSIKVKPVTGYGVAFRREGLHNQVPHHTEREGTTKRRMSVLGLVEKQAA